MLLVVLNRIVKELRILFSHLHEVYPDAIISQSFTMYVSDCATNLQKLFVLVDGELVLSEIVI